jgi:hypothetical protein
MVDGAMRDGTGRPQPDDTPVLNTVDVNMFSYPRCSITLSTNGPHLRQHTHYSE